MGWALLNSFSIRASDAKIWLTWNISIPSSSCTVFAGVQEQLWPLLLEVLLAPEQLLGPAPACFTES